MKHLWEQTAYGQSCVGCGYFTYTDEAKKECSGRYYLDRMSQAVARLKLIEKNIEQINLAMETPPQDRVE